MKNKTTNNNKNSKKNKTRRAAFVNSLAYGDVWATSTEFFFSYELKMFITDYIQRLQHIFVFISGRESESKCSLSLSMCWYLFLHSRLFKRVKNCVKIEAFMFSFWFLFLFFISFYLLLADLSNALYWIKLFHH